MDFQEILKQCNEGNLACGDCQLYENGCPIDGETQPEKDKVRVEDAQPELFSDYVVKFNLDDVSLKDKTMRTVHNNRLHIDNTPINAVDVPPRHWKDLAEFDGYYDRDRVSADGEPFAGLVVYSVGRYYNNLREFFPVRENQIQALHTELNNYNREDVDFDDLTLGSQKRKELAKKVTTDLGFGHVLWLYDRNNVGKLKKQSLFFSTVASKYLVESYRWHFSPVDGIVWQLAHHVDEFPEPKGSFMERYYRDPHWQAKRKEAIDFYGERCELSIECEGPFDVHHLHYKSLWEEDIEKDLRILCKHCHVAITQSQRKQRAERAKRRAKEELKNKGGVRELQNFLDLQ